MERTQLIRAIPGSAEIALVAMAWARHAAEVPIGGRMFEESGIGVEDLTWIQRDQFVYYVDMEHELSDPRDWPRFRENLVEALNSALGLDSPGDKADPEAAGRGCPHGEGGC